MVVLLYEDILSNKNIVTIQESVKKPEGLKYEKPPVKPEATLLTFRNPRRVEHVTRAIRDV